ncbi:MAG: hypothetical protein KGH82_05185, partial [Candidatus Micrarchaeota archaeon]|nr:hypothetical protein [Candidatus Micrarchaeota archaeon]
VAGSFQLNYLPCPSGNASNCQSSTGRTNFAGSFNVHSSPLLSPLPISITLAAQNATQIADGQKDKLTANLKLLGTPVTGATLNFTSNKNFVSISPFETTTDSNGNANSYAWSNTTGNVIISANFANYSANTPVDFTPPACITLTTTSQCSGSTIITIDGVQHSSLPQTVCFIQGSVHTYSVSPIIFGGSGTQCKFSSVSGCGITSQSGTFIASSNCTTSISTQAQYTLDMVVSPPGSGTTTPTGSNFYNANAVQPITASTSMVWFFSSWTGTGPGSSSAITSSSSVTLNGPITEQANFYSTSTSTTSSTSTTTTTIIQTMNPTSGNYADVVYTASTKLTSVVIASNMIMVQPGVTLDECGAYIQGNAAVYNYGAITDTCDGGAGGAGGTIGGGTGGSGSNGLARTSAYLTQTLTAGIGGGGGGAGGVGGGEYVSGQGAPGGTGGKGGGIVEIYAGNFINDGVLNVAGVAGINGGTNTTTVNTNDTAPGGGGGGGFGGAGGTIFIGYSNALTLGTTNVAAGAEGDGGRGQYTTSGGSNGWPGGTNYDGVAGTGGTGGSGGGGGGGGGWHYAPGGSNAATGGNGGCADGSCDPYSGCGGKIIRGGTAGTGPFYNGPINGGNGCNGPTPPNGQVITKIWTR